MSIENPAGEAQETVGHKCILGGVDCKKEDELGHPGRGHGRRGEGDRTEPQGAPSQTKEEKGSRG